MVMTAEITRIGVFSMQVCVPADWDDRAVKQWADDENRCGTEYGWHVRKEGDKALAGDAERVQCESRPGHVHIMLDA
jgi:hypothetical protein